jgi:transcriptional regulator with PAS, ATPase and Fis domain
MNIPSFPIQFAGEPSDALAIFEEGLIVYANHSFEKLYNSLKHAVRKRFNLELDDLNLDLQQSGKAFAHKHITLIPRDREIDIFVYLLNKSGSEKNCLLVLVDPANPPTESPSFITEHEQVLDSNQILKKGTQMKLSAAFSELVGEDPHFKAVLLKAQKAAKSDYPVLIEGESGTGKEILARTIHHTSRRSRKKFVDINCAAIPDQLIDSELFGYEKGAFTGATPGGRHGLFVEAHQGTLFFDEVSDASLQTQAKLLRVLNEGCFKRIGSTKNIEVDVRIISATNKDLSQLIKERRFREDLIYRLNTISIYLPPLRDRPEDILLLANFFLKKHSKKQHRNLQFSANCLYFLKLYHWPGNVRELKGVVDYMATMASGSLVTENYFPDFLLPAEHRHRDHSENHNRHFKADQDLVLLSTAVEHTEKEVIRDVLQKARTRSEAIKILGISRRTFYTKLKQYNLA